MIQNAINDFYFHVILPVSLLVGVLLSCLIMLTKAAAKNDTIRAAGKEAGKQMAKAAMSRAMDKFTKF